MSALWVKVAAYGAIAIGLFLWGWHYGGNHVQAQWNADKLVQAQAVSVAQAKIIEQGKAYEHQLQAAADQSVADRAQLDAIRNRPVPRVLCRAAASSSGTMPSLPTATGNQSPPGGVVSAPVERDISTDLTHLADRADDLAEQCRAALALWPTPR